MSTINEPSIQQPADNLNTQQHNDVNTNNDVNLSTQLSIAATADAAKAVVSGDSTIIPTSTTQQLFTCQTNTNSIGNLSFPLEQNYENNTKYQENWQNRQNLLDKLKSQRIVKNLDIFHKFKSKQITNTNLRKFPVILDLRDIENGKFPRQNKHLLDSHLLKRKLKKVKSLKKTKFPLKVHTDKDKFLCNKTEKPKTILKLKKFKKPKFDIENKLKVYEIDKKSLNTPDLKKFPCSVNKNNELIKEFPLTNHKDYVFSEQKLENLKFPLISEENPENFPLDYKFLKKPNVVLNLYNKPQLEIERILKPIKNNKNSFNFTNKDSTITKFPSAENLEIISYSRFPLQSQNVQITNINKTDEQDHWNKINNFYNMKTTSTSLTTSSLTMTQFSQNIDNEHVSQVQDAPNFYKQKENPPSPSAPSRETIKISENIQTPPQTILAKTTNDGDYDDKNDVFISAAINSINNTHPKDKVNVYVEKIELIQDAIVALFETIKNNLTTNHNREEKRQKQSESEINIGSSNAIIHGHEHDNDENAARFALTPPIMSVTTSGRSSINESNEEDLYYTKTNNNIKDIYAVDLVDLYDREVVGGQIVECCSDVRDTLAEAVDYGVTKTAANRTGSFLVKSETVTFPNSPIPQTLNESIDTSPLSAHTDYTNTLELLPKENNVFAVNFQNQIDVKNNLEFENPKKTIDEQSIELKAINDINRFLPENLENKTRINNLETSEKVREMTVTRLAESNEHETTNENNNHLQTNEALEHKADILSNDLEIDEMKYEMNRVKGAMPSTTLTERARLGKHDSNITGSTTTSNHYGHHGSTISTRLNTSAGLDNTRLPTSLGSTRHYNESSYTPRSSTSSSSLKTDSGSSLTHAGSKRSSVHTHLPQETISHRTSSLHDPPSQRSHLTTSKHGHETALKHSTDHHKIDHANVKPSNDHSSETSTSRRPSLGPLRNTQSTSSVDLPHYTPSSTKSHDPSSTLHKAISIDSPMGVALPDRTRLRRQRRLRSQDSQDEAEDPIERLNRLKARISASLSEVKGVLKQYSTEGENDNENQQLGNAVTPKESKEEEEKKSEEPVKFRFVKKIRRRSLFTEEEEKAQKEANEHKESSESKGVELKEGKDETDNVKIDKAKTLPEQKGDLKELALEKSSEKHKVDEVNKKKEIAPSKESEAKESKLNKQLYTLKEENHEHLEDITKTETQVPEKLVEDKHKNNEKLIEDKHKNNEKLEEDKQKNNEKLVEDKLNEKDQQNSKNEEEIKANNVMPIVKQQEELKHKNDHPIIKEQEHKNELKEKEHLRASTELQTIKEGEESKGAIAKPPLQHHHLKKHENKPMENGTTEEHTTKVKKRIVIKPKDPLRRASLAAVEGSKIEPPVNVAIPAKIHRRPSDSEAVVKKKLITAKINTSGIVEEVTPKPKIVKVKKSLTKNSTSSQLTTTQQQVKEKEETKINDKSNEQEKDNKSIDSDKNKDVLMPKHAEPQQQEKQEQINDQITSQKNLLLPTQLVIDETASLNSKTIENSVLQPKEQKQQQHDQQKQQEEEKKQATTIQTTTTNFKSNDLQAEGAMLENLTTVLSSSTTSEANGQIKRENNAQQKDDLRDLLQQETTLIAQTDKKTNEVKQQPKLKDLLLKQQSTEKFQEKLENHQTAKEQNHQKTLEQQVVATTDVAIVKSENLNRKDEDVKDKDSLKEPCIDKTSTSTHVVADQQKHQQHNQLPVEGEQTSITHTVADTKTISSPLNSISSPTDSSVNTTTATVINSNNTETLVDENITKAVPTAVEQLDKMPELQLAPAPVQTAEIIEHPEAHKKKTILKKVIRQTSQDKSKKAEPTDEKKQPAQDAKTESDDKLETDSNSESLKDDLTEEGSESTELSETTTSEEVAATQKPKKERKVKKKVIIKRQKRRLSIDNFFFPGTEDETQNPQIETLEKPIAYVSDDENDEAEEKEEASKEEEEEVKKPLKSCIMHKEYHIGDQVLYAERFKKTQIKWRRGRIKDRITSISYLLDIDGKEVSSHINYLKKYTGRKVRFSGKEYLEIDYEQLAEEEEKAERLQRRTYSIWNMV